MRKAMREVTHLGGTARGFSRCGVRRRLARGLQRRLIMSVRRLGLLLAAALVAGVLPGCLAESGDEEVDEASEALRSATRKKRAKEMFAAPVLARMWMPGHKTVGNRTAAEVAKALEVRDPSMVSGLIRVDADPNLDKHAAAFADFRAVRSAMKGVAFDVVLNACQYTSAEQLTKHLAGINARLGGQKPESWFFDFYDTPLHKREGDCDARGPNAKAMLRKTAEWAHRQGQLIGGNVWSAVDLPEGADYYSVPDEHGRKSTLALVSRMPDDVVRLVHVENNPQNCSVKEGNVSTNDDPRNPTKALCKGSGGDEYIWRMTPAERKKYDEDFVAEGRRAGYSYMRPVFFPLSDHLAGGGAQAFDRNANRPAKDLPFVMGP